MTDRLRRGAVPPGTYAKGARSPVVYVLLCPACAGYAPTLPEDFPAEAHCQGCGAYVREVHRFQALIMSAANGGCMCDSGNRMDQVTGDLPTEESALAVWTEVKTRPALAAKAETRRAYAGALARVRAAEVRKTSLDWATLGEPRPYEITAVAEVLGLDPEVLWDHVEGVHGWEPHDEGYEDAVWAAAECGDPEHLKESRR